MAEGREIGGNFGTHRPLRIGRALVSFLSHRAANIQVTEEVGVVVTFRRLDKGRHLSKFTSLLLALNLRILILECSLSSAM